MKKLESIHFHQFRGIRDLRLEHLGQINLLVGINNSGKTSVLEGLSIYCHPLDLREWLRIARQREQENRFNQSSVLDSIQWLFPKLDLLGEKDDQIEAGKLLIDGNGSYPVKKLQASYEVIEGLRISERKRRRNLAQGEQVEDEIPEIHRGIDLHLEVHADSDQLSFVDAPTFVQNFQLWEDDFIGKFPGSGQLNLKTSVVTPSSHRSEVNQLRLLSEASFQNFKADVVSLLREVDAGIIDLEILVPSDVIASRPNTYIQHEKLGLAPLSTFGDGIRRLLHIALKLASVRGGILLIDELEVTIHTEALQNSFKWLVRWCKQLDVQLFATTHSLEAVDALLDVTESDSDLVLHRLEPRETHTRVVRHDWNRLKLLREELGQEVRW
ncbi:MAG: AAA family ATPase [Plectolyngbya sp. WJT66-NPBG17]|jgi:predicted ATP-dependent endonuclease of OLD family|nr:AAA family ATPase [Plectolyngbya sp. WJT66-NPBG17]MBW4524441.1 AAA family ATPase [Phormidium tanganyikae FI6-MK23]